MSKVKYSKHYSVKDIHHILPCLLLGMLFSLLDPSQFSNLNINADSSEIFPDTTELSSSIASHLFPSLLFSTAVITFLVACVPVYHLYPLRERTHTWTWTPLYCQWLAMCTVNLLNAYCLDYKNWDRGDNPPSNLLSGKSVEWEEHIKIENWILPTFKNWGRVGKSD